MNRHALEGLARGLENPGRKFQILNAWREWDGSTPCERAALEWTEAVTLLAEGFVPDVVYQTARGLFNENGDSFGSRCRLSRWPPRKSMK